MKFMIEFNPPVDFKNEFEKRPDLQQKVGKAFENIKPVAGWFTWRYGFVIVEADNIDELDKKVTPINHLFKTDAKVSPAISLEEFPKLVAAMGVEAKKYE